MDPISRPSQFDPKAWARALAQREANGANLTLAQRTMWRAALKVPASMSAREFLQPREAAA